LVSSSSSGSRERSFGADRRTKARAKIRTTFGVRASRGLGV